MMTVRVQAERDDPRVRRTRALLQDALATLLRERPLERISINEIAAEATVNRATFYDHYPDKAALFDDLVKRRFAAMVCERRLSFSGCAAELAAIFEAICDYLADLPTTQRHADEAAPDTAIVAAVRAVLLEGGPHGPPLERPDEVISIVAWALYGAAITWLCSRDEPQAEAAMRAAAYVEGIFTAAKSAPTSAAPP